MNYVRSSDGLNCGKKYEKCPYCKQALSNQDFLILDGKELICSKCSIVYHIECGQISFCCSKWVCNQCGESCNSKKHWICMLHCENCLCE